MITLWFYLVMTFGSFGGTPQSSLSSTRPETIAGPFQSQAACLKHRGVAKDGVTECVSVRVRWLSTAPPQWWWTPGDKDKR